jgi:pimeloyl-ACP methyl ester carboxylesterase
LSHLQLPSGVRAEEITTSRLTTHMLESGSPTAPPLVLVHGNVSAAAFFAPLMAGLADQYHCIAPDLRGFGRSERKPVDARRGLRDFSDDVHALLMTLIETGRLPEGTAPVLLGWSLGGGVVLQYAIDHPAGRPGAARALVLESPMAPFGFGGTRDAAGTPCYPDFAGSGGGTANPEMVRRLGAGDRTDEDLVSPRRVLTHLYFQPPFDRGYQEHAAEPAPAEPAPALLPPGVEDGLVDAMLEMAIGDDNYPGDVVTSPNWPGVAPGQRGVNNAISPKYCDVSAFAEIAPGPDVLWIRGDADQIVSDTSLVDLGHLGALGAVPGWPGADVFPAQPMVTQMRALLDRYQAVGGRSTEHVLSCGHSPHLERPAEFRSLVAGLVA